jgi:hypothetical protein
MSVGFTPLSGTYKTLVSTLNSSDPQHSIIVVSVTSRTDKLRRRWIHSILRIKTTNIEHNVWEIERQY